MSQEVPANAAPEPTPLLNEEEAFPADDVILPWEEVEKRTIVRALRICNWNVCRAADRLEIGPATLYRKIKKYGIRLLRPVRKPCTCR
jgi:transcriptional regulator of acetoin/glycerol metabolism